MVTMLKRLKASPIVKWVGGKGRLLGELRARVPETFGRYYEPFAGGAALFFDLAPERAVLSDSNADLMAMYATVAREPEAVIRLLAMYKRDHSETQFYGTRKLFNDDGLTPVQRAAALIYLNRVCFNGLWRVNADGEFNVPIGRYENPTICNASALRAAAAALARAELRTGGYGAGLHDVQAGDLVYLDPPYDDTFAGYTLDGFGRDQQRLLALEARELVARGVNVIASNSDTPFIRDLYADFVVEVVQCNHSVSGNSDGRSVVNELIITGGPAANARKTHRAPNPVTASRGESPTMTRRQTELPHTRNDKDVPIVCVEAGDKFLADRRDARRAKERQAESLAGVIQLMKANGVPTMRLKDPETGIWLSINAKSVDKISVVRVRDDGEDSEDFEIESSPSAPGPHPSLIRQAEADALATNVEVNEDGDVGVPDTAAPKSKAKRKPKKAAAKAKDAEGDPVVTTGDGKARSVPKRGDDAEGGAN